MLRGSKTPLKIKENENGCPEEKEEASFPLSQDQKSCKVTKPKVIRASKKENFPDGSRTRPHKRALEWPKGPGEDPCRPRGVGGSRQLPGSCLGALGGDVLSEPPLPLDTTLDFSSSRAVPLGNDFYSTPETAKVGGKPDFGLCEQRRRPADFAAVATGIARESSTKRATGTSPTSLKFRRRSTIGLRGSPENNTLIRYLAQHRSSRQKEAFTQISPFNHANVRSLKDKIDAFQTSFGSLQEAEGEAGLSHLGEAAQERASSQNKAAFKKEPNLERWSEKFMLGNRGAAWKENLSADGTRSSRRDPRTCSILSPLQAVTATGPAAAQEWVYEQQNPIKSLETAVTGDILETGHVPRCEHSPGGTGSDALADLSTRRVGFGEDLSLGMLDGSQTPVTPPQTGNIPSSDLSQSGSLLRSILKKTPGKEFMDSPEESSNSAIDRGGGEPAAVSNCVKAFETLQTDTTESQSSKTPKKKKVTFGEVLSPEIFDEALPANTPLRRGASPGCPQGQGPCARPALAQQPLPPLDFGWDEEGVEPLQEFLEGSVAAETPSSVENAEVAETDKAADTITTCSAKRKQGTALAQDSARDTENPTRNKVQRQKNPTTAAPKKSQKTKYPAFGRRKKKKVKKSLYGQREMASKKPLLSPIPEIPEVFSSVSSPKSPKALFAEAAALGDPRSRNGCRDTPQEPALGDPRSRNGCRDTPQEPALGDPRSRNGCRDTPQEPGAGRMRGKELWAAALCPGPGLLEEAAATSSGTGDSEVPGSLESAPGAAAEFPKIVPDAEGDFDTSEYFQQGEETPREKEAKESSSLIEKRELQGNLLSGLEILEQQDLQEGAQRTQCPQKDSGRGDPARRRRRRRRSSSAFYFPPVENLGISGADVAVSSYSVEEVLSVPQPCRRKSSSACAELRVRRSMRLSKDAASEGLAWIQLPWEIPKARRSISTSILAGAENIHPREQPLLPFPAPGKENQGSAPAAAAPGRRGRRRSLCEATARDKPWAPTQRRRNTNSGWGKDRSDQKPLEEAETLELQLKEVSGIPDFLK